MFEPGLPEPEPCRRRRSGAQDRVFLERHDSQLRRRLAEERPDEEELVEVAVLLGLQRTAGGGEARLDLEVRAAARRERALRSDAPAGDEERARVAVLGRRRDDAPLDRTQPRSRSSSLQTRSSAWSRSRSRAASSYRRASASSTSRGAGAAARACGCSSSSAVSARAASCARRRERIGPSSSPATTRRRRRRACGDRRNARAARSAR